MKRVNEGTRLRAAAGLLLLLAVLAGSTFSAVKNIAVVISAGSKLADVPIADLVKYVKGTQKTWPDGKSFTLVMKDPELPEMRAAVQKLFGMPVGEVKAALAKLNESRMVVRVVESDEELLKTVEATSGAIGILDVYAINSSVKVLRVDGKLPFDAGYALRDH